MIVNFVWFRNIYIYIWLWVSFNWRMFIYALS